MIFSFFWQESLVGLCNSTFTNVKPPIILSSIFSIDFISNRSTYLNYLWDVNMIWRMILSLCVSLFHSHFIWSYWIQVMIVLCEWLCMWLPVMYHRDRLVRPIGRGHNTQSIGWHTSCIFFFQIMFLHVSYCFPQIILDGACVPHPYEMEMKNDWYMYL